MTTTLLPDFLTTGRASCTPQTADLFWSRLPADEQTAKATCATCPLLLACQSWALEQREEWGTWGGLTAAERLQLRRGRGWWIDAEGRIRKPCGSDAAYRQHLKYLEPPCDVCRQGQAERTEARRRQSLAVQHALPEGGSSIGYHTHVRLGERPCLPCLNAEARKGQAQRARNARRRPSASAPRDRVAA